LASVIRCGRQRSPTLPPLAREEDDEAGEALARVLAAQSRFYAGAEITD
jgi:hypothetical protein